ncbi:MAG: VOC family protein [Phycisphaerales bacterium]
MAATSPPTTTAPNTPDQGAAVNNLILMAHVADVERSLAFYTLMGFQPRDILRDEHARAFWAAAASAKAEIMFTRASGPVDPTVQAVIFYMYAPDVDALRQHLLTHGVSDGGPFCGQPGPNHGRAVVFEVARPFYMPAGELRVADPDGYCILVGQLET